MKKSVGKKIVGFVLLSSLVSAGVAAIGIFKKRKKLNEKYDKCYFFNGETFKFNGEEFEGDTVAAVFGGVEIDFTGATLKDNKATLELYGEFAGISITVPKDWNVKATGDNEKAGVSNSTEYDEKNEEAPLLIINYNIKYAGLEIKRSESEA